MHLEFYWKSCFPPQQPAPLASGEHSGLENGLLLCLQAELWCGLIQTQHRAQLIYSEIIRHQGKGNRPLLPQQLCDLGTSALLLDNPQPWIYYFLAMVGCYKHPVYLLRFVGRETQQAGRTSVLLPPRAAVPLAGAGPAQVATGPQLL